MKSHPTNHSFDAVVVLCGGVFKEGNDYHATTYAHSDEFGMLGGAMRVTAAAELYLMGISHVFLFSSGRSAKSIASFGSDVPTDAHIYGKEFVGAIESLKKQPEVKRRTSGYPPVVILYDETSTNTFTNLVEIMKAVIQHGWTSVALLSSDCHLPRIKALYRMIQESRPDLQSTARVDYVSAEQTVIAARPGVYDAEITKAYKTSAAKARVKSEANGLQAIQDGRYFVQEFQTVTPDL